MKVNGIYVSAGNRDLLFISPPDWGKKKRGVKRAPRSWRSMKSAREVFEVMVKGITAEIAESARLTQKPPRRVKGLVK